MRAGIAELVATLPESQRPSPEEIEAAAQAAVSPSRRALLAYDPAQALSALDVPVLAFYGDKDLQVPPSQSEPVLRERLAGNPDTTIRILPGINHLLQPSATGAPSEYEMIETTIAPAVLDLVTDWMRERF